MYGALGARTSAVGDPALYAELAAAYAAHRVAPRPADRRWSATHGAEPVAAEPAYELPTPLDTPDRVTRAALDVERRCEATYAWVVEQTSGAGAPAGGRPP